MHRAMFTLKYVCVMLVCSLLKFQAVIWEHTVDM